MLRVSALAIAVGVLCPVGASSGPEHAAAAPAPSRATGELPFASIGRGSKFSVPLAVDSGRAFVATRLRDTRQFAAFLERFHRTKLSWVDYRRHFVIAVFWKTPHT